MADGGEEPATPKAATLQNGPEAGWTAARVVAMFFTAIGWADRPVAARRGDRRTDRKQLNSASYAITTEDIDLGADELDWAPEGVLNVRVQVDSGKPVARGG